MLGLGSLFDGIGVFPLAASRSGIEPVWASEVGKAPVAITKRHFPGMAHLGDITKMDGGKIPPVHIITFGSPCQNLSQCGTRTGLAGEQSGLFYQAIRIIKEMRKATNDIFPIIAVWENVMGAVSSNDRFDYQAVIQSFTAAEVPMPFSGRWANAGMVRGRSPDLAWRTMDAQYWGRPPLPQRRRRIFLVADFGGRRAAEILFRSCVLQPDIAACGKSGMPAADGNRIPVVEAGREIYAVYPFQKVRMRGNAKHGNQTGFIGSFGKPTDPFPTLLASDTTTFALWRGDDYKNGVIRDLTPLECERLMGLPEGWTKYGADGAVIPDSARYKALGNAIALPCAEYIMEGITAALQ
jgi:DNA (cytosine-5)-methyltransferase 1